VFQSTNQRLYNQRQARKFEHEDQAEYRVVHSIHHDLAQCLFEAASYTGVSTVGAGHWRLCTSGSSLPFYERTAASESGGARHGGRNNSVANRNPEENQKASDIDDGIRLLHRPVLPIVVTVDWDNPRHTGRSFGWNCNSRYSLRHIRFQVAQNMIQKPSLCYSENAACALVPLWSQWLRVVERQPSETE
jgi:hypothetical protein